MTYTNKTVLTDEEIDDAQEAAYRALAATGYNGGMGGFQWDRASARAIEAAVIERIQPAASEADPTIRNPLTVASEAGAVPEIGVHDIRTSKGGRDYVAEFFAKRIKRHDFTRYIQDTLAADFACALAKHLRATPPAPVEAGAVPVAWSVMDNFRARFFFTTDSEVASKAALENCEVTALFDRATSSKLYGPYEVHFIGPAVWAAIKDELPGHLAGKKVYVCEAAPAAESAELDYEALYEQMCERCDSLDAKIAEYEASESAEPAECATCGGSKVDPGGLPECRSCAQPTASTADADYVNDAVLADKAEAMADSQGDERADILDFAELIDDYQCAQHDGSFDTRIKARMALINAHRAALSRQPSAGDAETLHVAICQAVTIINGEPIHSAELHRAHGILRQAMSDYADAARAQRADKGGE